MRLTLDIDILIQYGTEKGIGRGIIKSGIDRSELFITSKMWFTENSEAGAYQAINRTLENLQTDYIDLYLIHQPLGDIYGAYRGLVKLMKENKIKAIGVDNMTQAMLSEFVYFNDVVPSINMVDVNVFNQREKDYSAFQSLGVQMEAWSPLGHGMKSINENKTLQEIGNKYKKSPTQVVLRWFMQKSIVTIPMSTNIKHMKENIEIFDFILTDEEMRRIALLDEGTGMNGYQLPQDKESFDRLIEWSKNWRLD